MIRFILSLAASILLSGCAFDIDHSSGGPQFKTVGSAAAFPSVVNHYHQTSGYLLAGEVMGIAYSGFRAGQHPDRGKGAVNPGEAEIGEDLDILLAHGFRLLRLYDSGENSLAVLQLIRERELPIKVLLGIWLEAEISNHEGCPWLTEPITPEKLAANTLKNQEEIKRGIALADQYPDIVVAVNVGNEALVDWNDHMVSLDSVIGYVRLVKEAIKQPVTVADNYAWWVREGAQLAAEVDFIGVHSYPALEHKSIDEGLAYTIENIEAVSSALPNRPIAILEAGWPSTAVEFPGQANEENQRRYYRELQEWAKTVNTTVFFFEAFDESWKGDPGQPLGAEKHWGLFELDRSPKAVMQQSPATLYNVDSVVWAVNIGGAEHTGIDGVHYRADEMVSGGERGRIDNIRGAQDSVIYQSYRSGELKIRRPMANGSYDIAFHFAEPEDIPVGDRVFDVRAQGRRIIHQLDVRQARSGNHISALVRTVTDVVVRDGLLDIELLSKTGTPILSGIVVRKRKPDLRRWELLWVDEFDYEGAPDPRKWNVEVWEAGRVNNEDQAYTNRGENVRVVGGRLVLEAHREDYGDATYTSARVDSRGKGDFLYGRVDIRARLAAGRGAWSALWMLPGDPFRYATNCSPNEEWNGRSECDAWPNSGEIDIMEHVGYDMQRVHATVHNRAFYTANMEQRNGAIEVRDVDREFHIYSLEWTPDYIHVFLDGSLYFSYFNQATGWQAWPYDHPYHIILNLAIGGWWGRAGGPIDDSIFPTRMEVDYVRVFRELTAAEAALDGGRGS